MNGDYFFVALALITTFVLMPIFLLSEYYYEWKALREGKDREATKEKGLSSKEATVREVQRLAQKAATMPSKPVEKKAAPKAQPESKDLKREDAKDRMESELLSETPASGTKPKDAVEKKS